MTVWGISALFHDAAISVVQDNKLVFAASAERYSRIKNDKNLNYGLICEALKYGIPDKVVWYEKPYKKFLRQLIVDRVYIRHSIKKYLKSFNIHSKLVFCDHHLSHLYSSLFTAPFDITNSLGVVIDTVGEFTTTSIWNIRDKNNIKPLYTRYYPNSLGLFYSSITDLVGLKPQNDEYILMGMAAYSDKDDYYHKFKEQFFDTKGNIVADLRFGCKHLFPNNEILANKFHMARGAQLIFEEELLKIIRTFLNKTNYTKIVYAGGCALNCTANSKLLNLVNNVWIFPNPGDAGASTGAALSIVKQFQTLKNIYLGYDAGNIQEIDEIVNNIKLLKTVGVINGRAEFGPRALGNRSILADPRVANIQDIVNSLKGRETFRPFAPAVLEEHCSKYFKIANPKPYKYMQYTANCIDKTIPGVVHIDGTSRVQAVDRSSPFLFKLLTRWFEKTGCPVLLNTSLNFKGYPLINGETDINEFKKRTFKIFTSRNCL